MSSVVDGVFAQLLALRRQLDAAIILAKFSAGALVVAHDPDGYVVEVLPALAGATQGTKPPR
jgi:hypothetical protein